MTHRTFWKDPRGSMVLLREENAAKLLRIEREEKGAAKRRDQHRCRWPEPHKCRFEMEAAHIQDASLLGPMHRDNLVTVCAWIHRRGPESIHGKQLKVEAETCQGARGPLSFWRQTGTFDALGQPVYHLVAREVRPFEVERD